ncbi:fumarate reductase subunit C [Ramlibacter sp. RBP-2]|uniref:Fumarate reductase subunit C n=1 Tax=Ramlibacter lithotrophicus TaxID=2606681 RepID=A0A7X6DHL2_9BURK|nr:fumarate reductase subunit C [Ramlibacter lithotrophicus]NKE67173.1 fumarate reductase subunit C [Ramlibacter lithotrophicus]
MNHRATLRRGYVRPMQGWWRRDPFFVKYMIREVTALAVLVYAIILMVGVVRLSQGAEAFNGWLAALKTPGSILLHLVLLASMIVHAKSWFDIMPKTMPLMFVGGHRVEGSTITRTGYVVTIVATVLVLALVWGVRA